MTNPRALVDCPCCNGAGTTYPGATVGMWAGLVPFDATADRCDLCGGEGQVAAAAAQEYETQELAREGDDVQVP
jgi:DnaJ-class molecular chaperone